MQKPFSRLLKSLISIAIPFLIHTPIYAEISSNSEVGKILNIQYQPTSKVASYSQGSTYAHISHDKIRQILQQNKIIDQHINNLNKLGLVLRQDLPVIIKDCDLPNAYWSRQREEIVICYDNISYNLFLFNNIAGLPLKLSLQKAIEETIFAFYHELGHALIELLPLNAVGQEEDTVDEFAAIMLLKSNNKSSADIVLAAAEYYLLTSNLTPDWTGEHSPNLKRMFNLVCFIYGSDPDTYAEIFANTFKQLVSLDKSESEEINSLKRRAVLCQEDFARKVKAWDKLLIPHSANQYKPWGETAPRYPNSNPSPPRNVSKPGKVW